MRRHPGDNDSSSTEAEIRYRASRRRGDLASASAVEDISLGQYDSESETSAVTDKPTLETVFPPTTHAAAAEDLGDKPQSVPSPELPQTAADVVDDLLLEWTNISQGQFEDYHSKIQLKLV